MNARLPNESATPMMEEPGLVRHFSDLEPRLVLVETSGGPILSAERIAYYLERGSRLRSEWWLGKIAATGRGIGRLLGRRGVGSIDGARRAGAPDDTGR